MKNKTDKLKWYNVLFYVLLFIIMLPWIIIIIIKDNIMQKKRKKKSEQRFERIYQPPPQSVSHLMPYVEPVIPASNEEFVSRTDEFVCIQYKSFNGLSGERYECQLIAKDDPTRKEHILAFLDEHPIEILLHGNINSDGCDMNHWEIRFIFADKNLNRRICGYGYTETSAPYLRGLVPILRNDKFRNIKI